MWGGKRVCCPRPRVEWGGRTGVVTVDSKRLVPLVFTSCTAAAADLTGLFSDTFPTFWQIIKHIVSCRNWQSTETPIFEHTETEVSFTLDLRLRILPRY